MHTDPHSLMWSDHGGHRCEQGGQEGLKASVQEVWVRVGSWNPNLPGRGGPGSTRGRPSRRCRSLPGGGASFPAAPR